MTDSHSAWILLTTLITYRHGRNPTKPQIERAVIQIRSLMPATWPYDESICDMLMSAYGVMPEQRTLAAREQLGLFPGDNE